MSLPLCRVSSKTSIMPSGATQRSDTKVLSSLKRNAPGRWPIERHHACPCGKPRQVLNPARCHRRMVAGCTTRAKASRLGQSRVIQTIRARSLPAAAAILAVLTEEALAIERIGLEAGPLSQWLYSALAEAGLPVICVETRHMKAALSAQINKSDRNDARGIAQMMRVGLYRPVHVNAGQPKAPHAADQSPAFAGQGA